MRYIASIEGGKNHLKCMDGLRGIAILMVVGVHLGQAMGLHVGNASAASSGVSQHSRTVFSLLYAIPETVLHAGGVGVDIFFFISGFVLFYPYAQHLFEERPLQTLAHYFTRRVLKIVPSYWLSLTIATILLSLGAFLPSEPMPQGSLAFHFFSHLLFLHNFWAISFGSINGSFWTLAVEVQFYLIFPIIARFFMVAPWKTLAVLLGISTTYHVILYFSGLVNSFLYSHQLPAFLGLFGLGSFTSYIVVRNRTQGYLKNTVLWTTIACAGILAFYAVLTLVSNVNSSSLLFQYWQNSTGEIIGVLLLLISISLVQGGDFLRRITGNPMLVWFSTISYNLYLWNQSLFCWYYGHVASKVAYFQYGGKLNIVFSLFLVIGISWSITRWVETPILRMKLQR
jgi:peptidoglycan/LPS O-acetylase OafA/YrhL